MRFDSLVDRGIFRIPEYQRYYSWEKQQHDDLWTDLRTIGDKPHYFGTFVVQETKETETVRTPFASGDEDGEELAVFELIDGQQRITTVAILMRAMIDELQKAKEELEEKRQRELEDALAEIEESFIRYRNVFRIKLLDRDANHLKAILSSGRDDGDITVDSPSQERLWDAKEFYDDQFNDLRTSECSDIADFVAECLSLKRSIEKFDTMVYAIDSDNPERATVIFESVNARGISLSTLDKTKSFLMHMAYTVAEEVPEDEHDKDLFELVEAIRERFGDIYTFHQDISQNEYGGFDEATIQRYHFIQYFNWTNKDNHAKSQLLDTLKKKVRSLQQTDPVVCYEYLDNYSESLRQAYDTIYSVLTYEGDSEVETLIERMHALGNMAKFYPWFIGAWPTLSSNEERRVFCKAIETYLLRVYVVGKKDSHTGRAKLYRLARDLEHNNPPTVNTPSDLPGSETVSANIRGYVSTIDSVMNDYQDDDSFERSLRANNTYERMSSSDLRYLLYVYSIERSGGEGEPLDIELDQILSSEYTIEHIWPRSPGDEEEPIEVSYPIKDSDGYASIKERYEDTIHRLGNLTIASRSWNSTWGDAEYETKKEKYRDSGLWAQKEVAKKYDEWSVENIGEREDELVSEVMEIWSSPTLSSPASLLEI
jgi:hypothetical protein